MGLKSWNQLKMVDNIKTSQFEWKNLGLSISLSLLSQISDNGEMAELWQPRVPWNAQFIPKMIPNGQGTPTELLLVRPVATPSQRCNSAQLLSMNNLESAVMGLESWNQLQMVDNI